jgi:hypothetical protein
MVFDLIDFSFRFQSSQVSNFEDQKSHTFGRHHQAGSRIGARTNKRARSDTVNGQSWLPKLNAGFKLNIV